MTPTARLLTTTIGSPFLALLGAVPLFVIADRAGYYYEEILSRVLVIFFMFGLALAASFGASVVQFLFLRGGSGTACMRHVCFAVIAFASFLVCLPGVAQDRLLILFAVSIPVTVSSAVAIYVPSPATRSINE